MAPPTGLNSPGLASFLRSISSEPEETSIEELISLLRRRQIRNSRPCATATAYLLRRVVAKTRPEPGRPLDAAVLIRRVRDTGRRLVAAQPRELAVGNIVRRVLGLIREEQENESGPDGDFSAMSSDVGSESGSQAPQFSSPPRSEAGKSPLRGSRAPLSFRAPSMIDVRASGMAPNPARPQLQPSRSTFTGTLPSTSLFSLLSHPSASPSTPTSISGTSTPTLPSSGLNDLRQEVIEGIGEILDELEQSDDQIASYSLDYIHSHETILTYSSSPTVLRFLLKAAAKRKFTVIFAEGYPNHHRKVHSSITGNPLPSSEAPDLPSETFNKTLSAAGTTVVLIPDSALFAIMSRVNKVILGVHAVLSNGAFLAPAGSKLVAQAARAHHVPVVLLSGTYQLSPVYPHRPEELVEYGDTGRVIPYADRDLVEGGVKVENPLWDYVSAECVDLFVTNLGGCGAEYLYRVVKDQYRAEDWDL